MKDKLKNANINSACCCPGSSPQSPQLCEGMSTPGACCGLCRAPPAGVPCGTDELLCCCLLPEWQGQRRLGVAEIKIGALPLCINIFAHSVEKKLQNSFADPDP